MAGEVVDFNPGDPDGRVIHIHGTGLVLRCDVVRAQLIHVQLGKAITAATAAAPARPATAGDPGRLSVRQRNYILVLCGDLNVTQRSMRLGVVSDLLGRPVDSLNDLSGADAGHVITELKAMVDRVNRAADRAAATTSPEPF